MSKKIMLCATLLFGGAMMLSSCQGRKMSNMTPSGDTVEVNVNTTQDTVTDSLAPEDPLDASI